MRLHRRPGSIIACSSVIASRSEDFEDSIVIVSGTSSIIIPRGQVLAMEMSSGRGRRPRREDTRTRSDKAHRHVRREEVKKESRPGRGDPDEY